MFEYPAAGGHPVPLRRVRQPHPLRRDDHPAHPGASTTTAWAASSRSRTSRSSTRPWKRFPAAGAGTAGRRRGRRRGRGLGVHSARRTRAGRVPAAIRAGTALTSDGRASSAGREAEHEQPRRHRLGARRRCARRPAATPSGPQLPRSGGRRRRRPTAAVTTACHRTALGHLRPGRSPGSSAAPGRAPAGGPRPTACGRAWPGRARRARRPAGCGSQRTRARLRTSGDRNGRVDELEQILHVRRVPCSSSTRRPPPHGQRLVPRRPPPERSPPLAVVSTPCPARSASSCWSMGTMPTTRVSDGEATGCATRCDTVSPTSTPRRRAVWLVTAISLVPARDGDLGPAAAAWPRSPSTRDDESRATAACADGIGRRRGAAVASTRSSSPSISSAERSSSWGPPRTMSHGAPWSRGDARTRSNPAEKVTAVARAAAATIPAGQGGAHRQRAAAPRPGSSAKRVPTDSGGGGAGPTQPARRAPTGSRGRGGPLEWPQPRGARARDHDDDQPGRARRAPITAQLSAARRGSGSANPASPKGASGERATAIRRPTPRPRPRRTSGVPEGGGGHELAPGQADGR